MQDYKVNLHVLEPCNYHCKHCFAHFGSDTMLPIAVWKKIVDNCCNVLPVGEFNIAGGEPLLYRGLPELIRYINSKGIKCSIITNGFLMDEKWIQKHARYLTTIGFSIDSFDSGTMLELGRCTRNGDFLSKRRFIELCKMIDRYNPQCFLKLNTVVNALNKDENIAKVILDNNLPISRWKILKMKRFKNETFDNSELDVSDEEYKKFVETNLKKLGIDAREESDVLSAKYRTITGMNVVIEQNMKASYLIIDASGYLIDNNQETGHIQVVDCISGDLNEGLERLSFDKKLYDSRY